MSRRQNAVWVVAFLLVAAGAVVGGRGLRGGNDYVYAYDFAGPAYRTPDLPAGYSKGGFTGFDEVRGLDGRVIIAGAITSAAPDSLRLGAGAEAAEVRVTGREHIFRLDAVTRGDIRPGSTLVARLKPGTNEAEAVLVVVEP